MLSVSLKIGLRLRDPSVNVSHAQTLVVGLSDDGHRHASGWINRRSASKFLSAKNIRVICDDRIVAC